MRSERGQATIEWSATVLLVALTLAAAIAVVPAVDGRPLGATVLNAIVCAVNDHCATENSELRRAYGTRDAAMVKKYAPNIVYEPGTYAIPTDYRRCRERRCSDAPDDRDLDVSRSRTGERATAFTRVVRRGRRTYIQYWLYYPDSASSFMGSRRLTRRLPDDPFQHPDDWEGYVVRIDPDGRKWARATAHGSWQWCKQRRCRGKWGTATGWTRVSRGSHAGHIPLRSTVKRIRWKRGARAPAIDWRYQKLAPGAGLRERSTMAPGLQLIPAERLDQRGYRPLDKGIKPPWRKTAWRDPEAGDS